MAASRVLRGRGGWLLVEGDADPGRGGDDSGHDDSGPEPSSLLDGFRVYRPALGVSARPHRSRR